VFVGSYKILALYEKSDPYKPDPKIKRTFHLRRKKWWLENQRQKAYGISPTMVGGVGDQRSTLRDFVTPRVHGIISSITRPNVEVDNFELKLALISMVQQCQFGGTPWEDPNLHLSVFLEVCDTLKLNEVSIDTIQLHLFSFFLRDKARAWLHSLPPRYTAT